MIGQGPNRNELADYCSENGLGSVRFLGQLPRDQVCEELLESDFSLYTSLMDANPAVIWESISCSCPIIGWNLDGFSDHTDSRSALKIEVGKRPIDSILAIQNTLRRVLENKNYYTLKFASEIKEAYDCSHWNVKKSKWNLFYKRAIENYKHE